MNNPRKKGKLPPSSDSSAEASEVYTPRRPYGCSKSLRLTEAQSPHEPFRRDEEECTKKVMASATGKESSICSDSHVVENRTGTVEQVHAVGDHEVMRTLREKERLPPSSDSSPGAFQVRDPRAPHGSGRRKPPTALDEEEFKKKVIVPAADTGGNIYGDSHAVENGPATLQSQEGSRTHRNKGRLPPSFDSSPGAFPIQHLRASHGSYRPRPPAALTRLEPFTLDEEEYREELVQPAVETEGNFESDNNVVENAPDTVEAYAVCQDEEALRDPVYAEVVTGRSRKWRERPMCRAILIGSCLLLVGVVMLVLYLTKTIGGTSQASTLNQKKLPARLLDTLRWLTVEIQAFSTGTPRDIRFQASWDSLHS